MANVIKVGSIMYDVASLIKPHLGREGIISGRRGYETKVAKGPISLGLFSKPVCEYLGRELDEFQVDVRCECGSLHPMARLRNAMDEERDYPTW